MPRKTRNIIDYILYSFLFLTIAFFLLAAGNLFFGSKPQPDPPSPAVEEFDASYLRLNSIDKLTAYCDSLFQATGGTIKYPILISSVVTKRFYHNYSLYSFASNPTMNILARLLGDETYTAIVIPNDIMKFPNAACSQQSIICMQVLEREGIPVRKVAMFDSVSNAGHFTFEAFYDKGWHFFDVDEEPDLDVLNKYARPSAAFLANHPEIVTAAYSRKPAPDKFVRLLQSHQIGPVNKFPAKTAYFVQLSTKVFNYVGWLFALLLIYIRARYRRARAPQAVRVQNSKNFNVSSSPVAELG